jgi:hypothetical protein
MPDAPDLPIPRWWPEPITAEQYVAFTPGKLELVRGYLLDAPEHPESRLQLLALLLTNCGLEAAVQLASIDDWREAIDHNFNDF